MQFSANDIEKLIRADDLRKLVAKVDAVAKTMPKKEAWPKGVCERCGEKHVAPYGRVGAGGQILYFCESPHHFAHLPIPGDEL